MRKALLTVLLVSVIVFVSISFMGASCTVTPGPGPGTTYLIRLVNNSSHTFWLEIYENPGDFVAKLDVFVGAFSQGSLYGDYGDYVKIFDITLGQYLLLPPSFTSTSMFINSGVTFTVGAGGGWVTEER